MKSFKPMSKPEFEGLKRFIYQQSGLYFSEAKTYFLENKLSKRLIELGFTNFQDYLDFLKGERDTNELHRLFEVVTTNETSFYRNPQQIEALTDHILPRLVGQARNQKRNRLKIWSAACSSGEEPYSLAMALLEHQSRWQGLKIKIEACDLSHRALDQGKKGLYAAYSMRNLPEPMRAKYFEEKDGFFQISDKVRGMVHFSFRNLMEADGKSRSYDAVFCRNLLIYLDLDSKRKVVENLYQALRTRGYLFIGPSESLHNVHKNFELEHFVRALVYLKN